MFRFTEKNKGSVVYKRNPLAPVIAWVKKNPQPAFIALMVFLVVSGAGIWVQGSKVKTSQAKRMAQIQSPLPPEWLERYFGVDVCPANRMNWCGPKADPDNDGLSNYEEFLFFTHPLDPDTNGDGMLDGEAVRRYLNPLTGLGSPLVRDISNPYQYNPFADQILQSAAQEAPPGEMMSIDQINMAAAQITDFPTFDQLPWEVTAENNQAGVDKYLGQFQGLLFEYIQRTGGYAGINITDVQDRSLLEAFIEENAVYAGALVFTPTPSDLLEFHKSYYASLIYKIMMAQAQFDFLQGEVDENQTKDRIRSYLIYYTRALQNMDYYSRQVSYDFPLQLN